MPCLYGARGGESTRAMLRWAAMGGLGSIAGQSRAVAILRAAIAARKLHHGYLFEGPEGAGKAATARALAQALNCERRDPDGCGTCGQCLKIEAGTHPDVIAFDMTPKGLTERVRELITTLGFRPHEGRARVIVFDPAHGLAPVPERAEAANVLLKTLEEPPADTHFVLVTAEPRRLPVTVRSRCQRVRFEPRDEEALLDPESAARREELLAQVAAAARGRSAAALFEAAGELGGDRDEAVALMLALWRRLHDALLVREQLAAGRLSAERARAAAAWSERPSSALLDGLRATDEAVESLRGNVAPALVVEHLLLQLARDEAQS
jgi:DNA polymerase-3 subunit gamma/tau